MDRLGSPAGHAREMVLDDILFQRIKLMLYMAERFLEGAPLGDVRRQAMGENAAHVEMESCYLLRPYGNIQTEQFPGIDSRLFFHTKLLATRLKAIADGASVGENGKSIMTQNIAAINRLLTGELENADVLSRVA